MNHDLLTILTVFVIITGLAALTVAILLAVMARRFFQISQRADGLLSVLETRLPPLLSDAQAVISETRDRVRHIGEHLTVFSQLARKQGERADDLLADIADRVKLQIIRLDGMVSDVMTRVEQTLDSLQNLLLRPMKDFGALINGFRTGLDFFVRRRSSPPAKSRQDEEMFI